MSEMSAKILLWGIAGAGKTTTLQTIHNKLRADLRGELRHEPTRLDPTVRYEALSITLGSVGGVGTQIEIIAAPGAEDLAMTRKQILDEVDGLILVLDCSPERIGSNLPALDELRESLASYGRKLESLPIVLQYNKRDLADPFEIEDLHRRIGLTQAAVFETIAPTGHGVFTTLTTISKHVVRTRRGAPEAQVSSPEPNPAPPPTPAPVVEPEEILIAEPVDEFELNESPEFELASHEILEAAILAEGEEQEATIAQDSSGAVENAFELDLSDDFSHGSFGDSERDPAQAKPESTLGADLRIVSVGQASVELDGGLRLSLVLGDGAGKSRSVVLSLRLDALVEDGVD
jgi:mutual gliding-motility protein MglA